MYSSPVRSNYYARFVEWSYKGSYPLVAVVSCLLFTLGMAALIAFSNGIVFAAWTVVIVWPTLTVLTYFFGPLRYRRHEKRED